MSGRNDRVAVVVLNWNGKADTLECLASVTQLDYRNYEIVVVDNGSTDDSVAVISRAYPGIVLLSTGKNLGYAGGNNVGILWALDQGADYILILNNDTIVSADLLGILIDAHRNLPGNSILGAKIYFYDRPDVLWFAGGFWNEKDSAFEHVGYGKIDGPEFDEIGPVDYITGCALFVSSTVFRDVGLLGEEFFLTYEETDWCYRARARGHLCYVVPSAKLWHKVSSSFGGDTSPIISYFMSRNKLLWARKHLSRAARTVLHKENIRTVLKILFPPVALTKENVSFFKRTLWAAFTWLKILRRNMANPYNKAILFGLRDYYLGRFGDCPPPVRRLKRPLGT